VAAVLAGSTPAHAQKVDLRPKWQTGQTHRFRMELSSSHAVNLSGDKEPEEMRSIKEDIRFSLHVVDGQAESDSTVEMVFDEIKVSMDSGPGKDTFDSTQKKSPGRRPKARDSGAGGPGNGGEEAGVLADAFKPLIGSKLILVVDTAGNITSVSGGQNLIPSELTANLTQKDQMSRLFGPLFSPRKGDGLAAVGETWENEDVIESPLIGRLRMKTRHKVLSTKADREAIVGIDGTIATDSEGDESPYTIREGEYKGSYAWGLAEGMLRRLETSQKYAVEADLGLGDQPVSIGSTVTMKVTRED
jgi:hypothetical protein